jgi:hypothetical protein
LVSSSWTLESGLGSVELEHIGDGEDEVGRRRSGLITAGYIGMGCLGVRRLAFGSTLGTARPRLCVTRTRWCCVQVAEARAPASTAVTPWRHRPRACPPAQSVYLHCADVDVS